MTTEAIISAALSLPEESRAKLAETLIRSLDESVSAKYWPEWEIEISERLAAYERGEVRTYSREEVMQYLDEDTAE